MPQSAPIQVAVIGQRPKGGMVIRSHLAKLFAISMTLVYSEAMAEPANCRIENSQHLMTSMGPDALCQRFQDRLLEASERSVDLSQVEIVLNVHKGNAIHAILTDTSDSSEPMIPATSIEVMDRELRVSDLDDLADAIGEFLLKQER